MDDISAADHLGKSQLYSHHRDRYLEQKQTEIIETEVKDVDRIRVTKW